MLEDNPARSWSTGWSSTVLSHYRRLLTFDAKLAGNAYNNAVSGARMSDLARQLRLSAAQGADYVTIEMGANDLCRSSVGAMTSASTFESQFRAALSEFVAARRHALVFVASIPNLQRLWDLFGSDPIARFVWDTFDICQSMLSLDGTDVTRAEVVAREAALNAALAEVCAEFTQCRWDGYAVFSTPFSRGDVSSVDYFHPSTQGQNHLAEVTWNVGYWPTR